MPESVSDRYTKAHEYVFMFIKSERYYFDAVAVQEPAVHGDTPRDRTRYRGGTQDPKLKHNGFNDTNPTG
jgi:hypothetical protein